MKQPIIIIILCIISKLALAQFGGDAFLGYNSDGLSAADAQKIKTANIFVLLFDEDDASLTDISGSKSVPTLKIIKDAAQKQNEALRSVMEKFWPYGNSITYISDKDFDKMSGPKFDGAIIITLCHIEIEDQKYYFNLSPAMRSNDWENDVSKGTRMEALAIGPATNIDARTYMKKTFITVMMPHIISEDYEIAAALKCATYTVDQTIEKGSYLLTDAGKNNASKLKTMKLAIYEPQWDAELNGLYPYAFEVMTQSNYAAVVSEKKKDYAFMALLNGVPVVVSAETNEVLFFPAKGDIFKGNLKGKVSEKSLGLLVKAIES